MQLDRIEGRFTKRDTQVIYPAPPKITDEENLQPHWKNMESRVTNRKPSSHEGKASGRKNLKKTDEEMWLQEGLYDHPIDDSKS